MIYCSILFYTILHYSILYYNILFYTVPGAQAMPLAAAMPEGLRLAAEVAAVAAQVAPGQRLAAKMAAAAARSAPLPAPEPSTPGAAPSIISAAHQLDQLGLADAGAMSSLLWSLVCTYADGYADEPLALEQWQELILNTRDRVSVHIRAVARPCTPATPCGLTAPMIPGSGAVFQGVPSSLDSCAPHFPVNIYIFLGPAPRN